jgi:5'-methylthioadenosine phosphorylase
LYETGLYKLSEFKDTHELEVDTPFGKPSQHLVCGKLNGVDCVLLQRHGRDHCTAPSKINYRANLYALKSVGCQAVVVTTACGSLTESYKPGDIVLVDDFIDRTYAREQTYFDHSSDEFFGVCHVPMYPAFSRELRSILIEASRREGIECHSTGTMLTIEGPRFSSRAESKMFQLLGAHTINMTTVPEVVLAKELGLPYSAIAIVTDYDCWREHVDDAEHVAVQDVLRVFQATLLKATKLIVSAVPDIAAKDWSMILEENQKLIKASML